VKNRAYDETLRKDANVLANRELRVRLGKISKNEDAPAEVADQVNVDPEQIGKIVQDVIITTAASVGAIVVAKKILDIAGEVITAAAKAKLR
jgi:intein-encoded DNA endonuclease-like protein